MLSSRRPNGSVYKKGKKSERETRSDWENPQNNLEKKLVKDG